MKRQSKIAIVALPPKYVGGFTIFCHTLVKELSERGYQIEAVYPPKSVLRSVPVLGYILAYGLLREKLKEYDLIIGHCMGLTGAIDLDRPIINSMHSCSMSAHVSLKRSYRKLGPKERKYLQLIASEIQNAGPEIFADCLHAKAANLDIDKQISRNADKVLTVAPGISKEIIKYYSLDSSKVEWHYNGVEEYWWKKRKVADMVTEQPVNIVYSGRGGATTLDIFIKGMDRALAVVKSCPKISSFFMIHVTNDLKRERYIKLLNKLKVRYVLNVPRNKMRNYLREGDIYIHTSRSESFGMCLAEAMASGLVPVTFPTGFAPQLIKNGENGYLVDTVGDMIEKVKMLARHPEMRMRMGNAARETVIKNFSMEKMVDGYAKAINELLAEYEIKKTLKKGK